MLKASYLSATSGDDVSDLIGGKGIWTCYHKPFAGRCIQVASSHAAYGPNKKFPGGHLGCFWNPYTVTDSRQFWDMSKSEIEQWIYSKRIELGTSSTNPCLGCAFPRMSFDSISLEIGLGDVVRNAYLKLRRQYVGY